MRSMNTTSKCDKKGHKWGPMELASFTGNPHRKCERSGCGFVTLDPEHDVDTYREADGYHWSCSCGESDGPYLSDENAAWASEDH